jgi:quercetin dioxygenase-like cupin family protein
MGSFISILADGDETRNQFAPMEYRAKPGNEPPPHCHELEDETLFILEGMIEVYQGDEVVTLGPGDSLFAPKGTPHAWYILTPQLRMLIMVSPAHSDQYFKQMGTRQKVWSCHQRVSPMQCPIRPMPLRSGVSME